MDDTFKNAIRQIFQQSAFTEVCYINRFETTCICSPIGNNFVYTEAGLVDGVNFSLDLQLATLQATPHEGDKVQFRGKFYKIASMETDSANASMKIFLISTSKGS